MSYLYCNRSTRRHQCDHIPQPNVKSFKCRSFSSRKFTLYSRLSSSFASRTLNTLDQCKKPFIRKFNKTCFPSSSPLSLIGFPKRFHVVWTSSNKHTELAAISRKRKSWIKVQSKIEKKKFNQWKDLLFT